MELQDGRQMIWKEADEPKQGIQVFTLNVPGRGGGERLRKTLQENQQLGQDENRKPPKMALADRYDNLLERPVLTAAGTALHKLVLKTCFEIDTRISITTEIATQQRPAPMN
jgi:hypothetical protein